MVIWWHHNVITRDGNFDLSDPCLALALSLSLIVHMMITSVSGTRHALLVISTHDSCWQWIVWCSITVWNSLHVSMAVVLTCMYTVQEVTHTRTHRYTRTQAQSLIHASSATAANNPIIRTNSGKEKSRCSEAENRGWRQWWGEQCRRWEERRVREWETVIETVRETVREKERESGR